MARTYGDLVELAYEREMSQLLDDLASKFDAWRGRAISWYDLNDEIHQYHSDTSRWVWKTYRRMKPRELVVRAIALGILGEGDLPENLRSSLLESAERERDLWVD